MKSLVEFIAESYLNEMLYDIDIEIFNESLQEPHLIEIAKWLRQFGSKNKNAWANQSFSGVFGQFTIAWDKVTENDFKTYEPGDKEGVTAAVAVHKQGDKFSNNIVLFLDDNDRIFAILTCYGIKMMNLDRKTQQHPKNDDGTTNWSAWEDVNVAPDAHFIKQLQKETREMCAKHKFMVLNLDNDKLKVNNKIWDRRQAHEGIISPDMYYKIAQENRDRYKKIIAKNKAEKLAKNDTLSTEVNEIVTKVLELTQKMMQGGAKYADLDWKVQSLLESCYGKRIYTGDYRYGKSGYEGSDGLLYLFAKYVKTNMSAAGDSNWSTGDASKLIEPVKKKIEYINKQIADIESKM